MPDHVFTILSTGSLTIGESLVSANRDVRPSGIIEEIPFIKIILNPDENTRGKILSYARHSGVAIFTSANAARAVTAVLDHIPDWDIYCLGNETRKQVVSFFGATRILGAAGNAEGLSEKIIQQEGAKQTVFFCGDQRRNVLPDKLNEKGIPWQELVVYQTQRTPVRLTKDYDAILFFSPTAVASFFSINIPSSKTVLFALGETTAAALRAVSENEVFLSPKPDKECLLQMALDYHQTHPIT